MSRPFRSPRAGVPLCLFQNYFTVFKLFFKENSIMLLVSKTGFAVTECMWRPAEIQRRFSLNVCYADSHPKGRKPALLGKRSLSPLNDAHRYFLRPSHSAMFLSVSGEDSCLECRGSPGPPGIGARCQCAWSLGHVSRTHCLSSTARPWNPGIWRPQSLGHRAPSSPRAHGGAS